MTTTKAPLVIIVTGSDSGFGLLTARTLALAGHTVYGGLLHPQSTRPENYTAFTTFSSTHNRHLHGIHLDITSESIISSAITQILTQQLRIDVVIHNAGHMSLGPAEAFSPEAFHHLFDVNCTGCHRLNQAVLPVMRRQHKGLLVWISSSSAHGPSSPFLAPYFAAKAAQDSLAQTTALEVSQFGVESVIVTPGIFTSGTEHFGSAAKVDLPEIEREYFAEGAVMAGWLERCLEGSRKMGRLEIGPQAVADCVKEIVDAEHGKRPWRAHVEPEGPMAERVNRVRDEVRREYLERMGCEELMRVKMFTEGASV